MLCSLHPPSGRTGEHIQRVYRIPPADLEETFVTLVESLRPTSQFGYLAFDIGFDAPRGPGAQSGGSKGAFAVECAPV
jgi:hypothetical protein